MSDVMTAPQPVETVSDADDLVHLACECDDTWSLCGRRFIAGEDLPEDTAIECVDCVMADVCPRCGE